MDKTQIQKKVISEINWDEIDPEKIDKIFRILMDMEKFSLEEIATPLEDIISTPYIPQQPQRKWEPNDYPFYTGYPIVCISGTEFMPRNLAFSMLKAGLNLVGDKDND